MSYTFALGQEIPDDPAVDTYRSDFSSGVDGFGNWNAAVLSTVNGALHVEAAGDDPYIRRPIPGMAGKLLYVRYRIISASTTDVLGYLTNDAWTYGSQIPINPINDGAWHTVSYRLPSDVPSSCNLRLDLAQSSDTAYEVSDVYVGTGSYLPTTLPYTDITELVDVTSIKKIRRLHSELKPNVNRVEFRAQFSAALWAALESTEDIQATITKDGATYFTGYVSPNFETAINDGRKFVSMIIEDPTLKQLGRTITETFYAIGAKVCDPADTAHSLVHLIAAQAGATLAAGLPTISTVIPYVVVLPKDKTTWASLLASLLFCYSYVYNYTDSGELAILEMINGGTVTTTGTLSIVAGGGNVRRSLASKKVAHKYDDIRVAYDTVELKTGIVLFKDTSGASGSQDCLITLKAAGDAEGADYYPKGAGSGEVYAEWSNPDGLEVVAATSAALDTIIGGGIEQSRALANYYRRASFAYHNTSGYAQIITRMRIVGDAYVKTASNVARSDTTGGQLLLEYAAKFIFDTTLAQALARRIGQYYAHSCQTYNTRSKTDYAEGDYVLASDSVYSGVSHKCRIIGKTFCEYERVFEYDLEAVDDYTAISIVVETTSLAGKGSSDPALAQLSQMAEDSIVSPQEKGSIMLRWQDINGDGSTTGSYWATRKAALEVGIPTTLIDQARYELVAYLWSSPAVLDALTWDTNIAINSGTFIALWGNYYRYEAMTATEITRWARYTANPTIDCGECEGEPASSASYDCGEYPDWTAAAATIDCGEPAASTDAPSSIIDGGEVSAVTPTSNYDCGEYIGAPDAPLMPRRMIDCGVYE